MVAAVTSPVRVKVLLAVLAAWTVGYEISAILPSHPGGELVFGNWPSEVVQAIAAVLCGVAALRRRGAARVAWILIALGIVVWTAGDVYWNTVLAHADAPPVPSLADLGYLLFEPLVFAGLLVLIHAQRSNVTRTVAVDGLIAILAALTVGEALVIGPVAAHATGGTIAVMTNVAYPVADLGLFALIFGAFVLRGGRTDRTWRLLGAGTLAFCIADSIYLVTSANGTYSSPSVFDIGWTGSTILFAAAAWSSDAPMRKPRVAGIRDIAMPIVLALGAITVALTRPGHSGGVVTIALGIACTTAVMARLVMTFAENQAMLRRSRHEAHTDALTGLGNRRALIDDLTEELESSYASAPLALALFDLDGFKYYNDNYGHEAGDVLLCTLSDRFAAAMPADGRAYRIGGDEFCALLPVTDALDDTVALAAAALSDSGTGFRIGCSHGIAVAPRETSTAAGMLRLADQRMYAAKNGGRASAGVQSKAVLVSAMGERDAELATHVVDVSDLAGAVARRLGLDEAEIEQVCHAAELHDIGKVAIAQEILQKPGPLDDHEWEVMRQHTLIGQRIVAAAPSLGRVAAMVRSSHERFDGGGYPDGLAGEAIPLGARIVSLCDAFDAMVTDRSYRTAMAPELALAELRRCSGGQFDPAVVDAFCAEWVSRARPALRLVA